MSKVIIKKRAAKSVYQFKSFRELLIEINDNCVWGEHDYYEYEGLIKSIHAWRRLTQEDLRVLLQNSPEGENVLEVKDTTETCNQHGIPHGYVHWTFYQTRVNGGEWSPERQIYKGDFSLEEIALANKCGKINLENWYLGGKPLKYCQGVK